MSGEHREHLGLLFVHGIGQQKRFEHLTGSVGQISEIMRQIEQDAHVSVVDRTAEWKYPAGQPDPSGTAPITLTYKSPTRQIEFECYEVWWADLGPRSGVQDIISFWIWGLGQWCAPIYQELDASGIRKTMTQAGATFTRPISHLVKLPQSVAGSPIQEMPVRFLLFFAGLTTFFSLVSWTLAKRVFATLLGQAPSPTLIEQYVGGVRTYEERATPGDTSVDDPGCPRRVGIRRRMISEMVAVGSQPFDGWFVLGHSLGSVIAYNGLTEIGHTLPNYLSEEQWQTTPASLKFDDNCELRDNISAMMPARPTWLGRYDVINRRLLFGKLRGFLTYGSPLDKFAAIWPRIVATATDRKVPDAPLGGCAWINLAAPHDPVAGWLKRYPGPLFPPHTIPRVVNRATPLDWHYLIAHLRYFAGIERCDVRRMAHYERVIVAWLVGGEEPDEIKEISRARRWLLVCPVYGAVLVSLWTISAALITSAGGLSEALFGSAKAAQFSFEESFQTWMGPVLGLALSVMMFCGLWRWYRENRLNLDLAKCDQRTESRSEEEYKNWGRLILMFRLQLQLARAFLIVCPPIALAAVIVDIQGGAICGVAPGACYSFMGLVPVGFKSTMAAPLVIGLAIVVQAIVNLLVRAPGTVEQETEPSRQPTAESPLPV